jgi:predicted metal-dependent enzyme (double-stranded beta helix superfamily)
MDQDVKRELTNVTPFPGHPAANLGKPERASRKYGFQNNSTPLLKELVDTLHATIPNCQPHALSSVAKASLRGFVCDPALLHNAHKQGDPNSYRRHLLYAAPDRSFSIISVVWNPGQFTPVHGHTAWGATGVYEGQPCCESYNLRETSPRVLNLRHSMTLRLQPGDIATVEPGIDDAHRIGNDTLSRCITVHIYGRDLLANPGSINIELNNL